MKNFYIYLCGLFIVLSNIFGCKSVTGASDVQTSGSGVTFMQCAEKKITASKGMRLNVLKYADGSFATNLIEGTTVSGTKFNTKKTDGSTNEQPGTYEGTRARRFTLTLVVKKSKAKNKYIEGYAADLEVNYPDLRRASGEDSYKSTDEDQFVCGEKINDFNDS